MKKIPFLFLVPALLFTSCLGINSVPDNYWDTVATGGDIEAKYTALGDYPVSSLILSSGQSDFDHYEIFYPTEMLTSSSIYPVVIMANGTGIACNKYEDVFYHMASWGFIVAGNDDDDSWDGESSDLTLSLLFSFNTAENSIFYGKVDTNNIGITGHSQGGVGVINAVTAQDNRSYYKAAFSASCTEHEMSTPF